MCPLPAPQPLIYKHRPDCFQSHVPSTLGRHSGDGQNVELDWRLLNACEQNIHTFPVSIHKVRTQPHVGGTDNRHRCISILQFHVNKTDCFMLFRMEITETQFLVRFHAKLNKYPLALYDMTRSKYRESISVSALRLTERWKDIPVNKNCDIHFKVLWRRSRQNYSNYYSGGGVNYPHPCAQFGLKLLTIAG